MAFLTAGRIIAEDVRVAVDVVFGERRAVCLFVGKVRTGVFEARDYWGVVLGLGRWRVEEEDVVGAQAFVEPVY